jgi:type II secretory pathway component PulM
VTEDEFSTVNVRRQQIARELDALRQHYLAHREKLAQLEKDAPSEVLAARYVELQREIDVAISKLGELASPTPRVRNVNTEPGMHLPPPPPPTVRTAPGTSGSREWRDTPIDPASTPQNREEPMEEVTDETRRLLLIVGITVIVLALLGYLVWRFAMGGNRPAPAAVVEETAQTETVEPAQPDTVAPATPSPLAVSPDSHDFGKIRKGTRAVRQFRIENNSEKAIQVAIKRSQCRCLWFDYDSNVPARSSTILAVTVDGAKAPAGNLTENVEVTSKNGMKSGFTVKATIE